MTEKPTRILSQFTQCIKNKNTYLKSSSLLIFTCGKKPNKNKPTARDRLIEYAKKHYLGIQFFMAEDFFQHFEKIENDVTEIDMLTLENQLADYSDCIIIILESMSAIAELGAFSNNEKLVPLLLVINDNEYKTHDSFINLGPLAKVNKKSKFKPVIHTSLDSILTSVSDITKRLENIERKYNKKIDLSSFKNFKGADPKSRIFFIADLIALFDPIKYSEIIELLKVIYGKKEINIFFELTVLEALRLISKVDKFYIRTSLDMKRFFEFKHFDDFELRSEIIRNYHKNKRERTAILKKRTSMSYGM